MAEEIKDETKQEVIVKGDEKSSSIDQGEFEKAKESAKALSDFLEDHEFDSLEEAVEAISQSKGLMGKLGNANIDEILEKAKIKDSWEEYWAEQDTKKKKEEEEPDERSARLEREVETLKGDRQKEKLSRDTVEENQRVLGAFNTEVTTLIEKNEAIPEEYRPYVNEFLGVDNPANEIDITNRVEVRKMAKEGMKKLQDFEQLVIKRYRDGKIKIPEITSTESGDTEIKERKPKNLAEAKKIATEILQKQFFGKTQG